MEGHSCSTSEGDVYLFCMPLYKHAMAYVTPLYQPYEGLFWPLSGEWSPLNTFDVYCGNFPHMAQTRCEQALGNNYL